MLEKWLLAIRLSWVALSRVATPIGFIAIMVFVVIATPYARASGRVTAFDSDPVLGKDELSKLRGGFNLANGAVINFGMQIQQFVNDSTKPVNTVDIALVQNNFTVTQTTGGKTTTTNLATLPQTFSPSGPINNGATQLAVTVSSQAVQSVIQNAANNQALTSVTTLNVQTQGLVNLVHQATSNAQLVQLMQMNSWTHH